MLPAVPTRPPAAILRCQGDGFPLPPGKYEQWRMVEMTFDPTQMVIR